MKKQYLLRLTGLYMYARLRRARLQKTPVGLAPFVVYSFRHIARPTLLAHCFKGGGQRHIQPERYTKCGLKWSKNME